MSAARRVVLWGKNPVTGLYEEILSDGSGALATAGSGGGGAGSATAAKQDVQTAILTEISSFTGQTLDQVGVSLEWLNEIYSKFPASQLSMTAPWPVQPVQGGSALFPSAAVPSNNATTPSVTKIQAILSGVESNSGNLYKVEVDTARRLSTVANMPTVATTSNSTAYQIQRTASTFACTVRAIEVFSTAAGYVVLVDKASAAADGDFPKGGSVWPIAANGRVEKEWFRGKSFSSGCVIALCSSVSPTITLAGSATAVFTVQLD